MGLAVVSAAAPTVVPAAVSGGGLDSEDQWRRFDNSVNAVSFGFVATAILISMFLIMAIFERFLRQRSSEAAVSGGGDSVGGEGNLRKPDHPSPKVHCFLPTFMESNLDINTEKFLLKFYAYYVFITS